MPTTNHQEEGHTCLLCGAKNFFSAGECSNCALYIKIALIVIALGVAVYYLK